MSMGGGAVNTIRRKDQEKKATSTLRMRTQNDSGPMAGADQG